MASSMPAILTPLPDGYNDDSRRSVVDLVESRLGAQSHHLEFQPTQSEILAEALVYAHEFGSMREVLPKVLVSWRTR